MNDAAQLCATGGAVTWTRGRSDPDLFPQVCDWFAELGFGQPWVSGPGVSYRAGAHRFTGTPRPLAAGPRMFTFLSAAEIRRRQRREPR